MTNAPAIRCADSERSYAGTEMPVGESGLIYVKPPSIWPAFTYLGNDATGKASANSDSEPRQRLSAAGCRMP
jgi:hypothetical protein